MTGMDTRRRNMRIRLRMGIATAFLLTVVPSIAGMLAYLHVENSRSAMAVATDAIGRTSASIVEDLRGMLSPVARVAEATAMFGKVDRNGLRRIASLRYFNDAVENLPQLEALSIGFTSDGAFFQLTRLNAGESRYGPKGEIAPPETRLGLRMLDASSGEMADSYLYLRRWGQVVAVDRGPVAYDPRTQPWFRAAWRQPGVTLSDAFVFPASGRPGLTMSHRVATDDGVPIGVVGADVSLDALARLLDAKRIGRSGSIFLVDEVGRVICHNRPELLVHTGLRGPELAPAAEFPDPVAAAAVARWKREGQDRFVAALGPLGKEYIVDFARVPDDIGNGWTVVTAVEVDEFIAPITRATTNMVFVGVAVIAALILVVLWLSHRLTRPLQAIVAETDRIRRFELDSPLDIRSRILEVDELAKAMDAMKGGLSSFGAYVPKDLVRSMIRTGAASQLGGERRPLTILFTDIKGFTASSEGMPPEEVMLRLSAYFQELTGCIHAEGGTVDKFIGDAIMAFWNAPLADKDHIGRACLALLACRDANRRLNERLAQAGQAPMPTRFGLHTGDVVVGNVGSADRMQYTALGTHVNLASRVEGLNKNYGTQLLVTGPVEQAVHDRFLFRPVDLAAPSGLSKPIPLFELVGTRGGESGESDGPFAPPPELVDECRRWQDAYYLYRARRWDEALAAFRVLTRTMANDTLAELYIDRCLRLLADPPGPEWDGVERYTKK